MSNPFTLFSESKADYPRGLDLKIQARRLQALLQLTHPSFLTL